MTENHSAPTQPERPSLTKVESAPQRCPVWLLAVLLGLVTVVLYWPSTRHDFINYDDGAYVTDNPHVQNGLTLAEIKWAFCHSVTGNWHPLTMLSLMVDHRLFGLQPWGYHLTSLLLHALNTALVLLCLHRLTGAVWRSVLVAALFGWHPVNVESVAWVAERKSVLSLCFGLLALLFYHRYVKEQGLAGGNEPADGSRQQQAGTVWYSSFSYWLSWFCLALGLMSKPVLVTWPFVMLLLDYWPLNRFQPGAARRLFLEKAPFFGLVAIVSFATMITHQQSGDVVTLHNLPLGARMGNVLISYCRYLGHMFWPANLSILYTHFGYWPTGEVLGAGLFLAGLTTLFWLRRDSQPFLLMGWLWFAGTLVPVIGWVQVGEQAMADRHAYIPLLGILILVIWGVSEATHRWRFQGPALSALAAVALVLCLVLTRQQLAFWQDSLTLFRHAATVTEDDYIVRVNLGKAMVDRGQYDEAFTEFQRAIRLTPGNTTARNDLGILLATQGQTNLAISQFQEAIRLNPGDADVHNNLGNLLAKTGQTNTAIAEFQESVRLNPNFVLARVNLANLLGQAGQINDAISQYQEILRLQPDNAAAHYDLGGILVRLGRMDAAIEEFLADLRLKPNDAEAHYNLGNLFARKGRIGEAITEFQAAVRLAPDDAIARNNLGLLLSATGQTTAALTEFQTAVQLMPNNPQLHYNFGNALAKAGQTSAAISQYQEALRLEPDYASAQAALAKVSATQSH